MAGTEPWSQPTATIAIGMDRLLAAHTAAVTYYRARLRAAPAPAGYLHARGLGAVVDHDRPWSVGYAPASWSALTDALHRQGFTDQELVAAGLAVRSRDANRVFDRFRNRIMFPIRSPAGQVVAFIGRTWQPGTAAAVPRYLNSPQTALYRKGEQLFGLFEQRGRLADGWAPVLVEGPVDVLAVWLSQPAHRTPPTGQRAAAGPPGYVAAAPCGATLTATQLAWIARLPAARQGGLTVAFDADPGGRRAADRIFQLLTAYPEVAALGVRLPAGSDPGELLLAPGGRRVLRRTLRASLPLRHLVAEYRIDQVLDRSPTALREVAGRMAIAAALAPLLGEAPPAAAVAAVRHIGAQVRRRTAPGLRPDPVEELLRLLPLAVASYLESGRERFSGKVPDPGRPAVVD